MIFFSLLSDSRRWVLMMVVVFLLGVGWINLSRVPSSASRAADLPASAREGFTAPDFSLVTLTGETLTLSEMRGKVVLINVWATWCAPCRIEMPALEQTYQDYRDQGLVVLGLNTTFQDQESQLQPFIAEYGLTFPILLDRSGEVSQLYQVRGLPTSFFVDRQGVIRSVVIGGLMNEAVIRSRVEELVKDKP